MTDLAFILGAILLAAAGGEAFLKFILGAALHLRVPKVVVATTLAAFATSSPELTVSSVAALAGQPEIGLGDALGSNVVNIALIFGLALLYGAVQTTRTDFGRDFYLALGVPVLTLLFVLDGRIERGEALSLLGAFVIWLVWIVRSTLRQRDEVVEVEAGELSAGKSLLLGTLGLGALIAAGRLFVTGATGIAASMGVDTYVIGAVLVAIGTSLPELVTVILSRLRGHDDVGVGTLIGSNLFNGLAIVGVAGTIHPITVPPSEVALTLAVGMVALLLLLPNRSGRIVRGRSVFLLLLYAGFVWATLNF
ncbi:MAG: calcium/sodium antiporter [Betaproteobacteria bacterium]|nr:calcium/sodium antiporter [Betaproteobacteria bacterium]